MYAITFLFFCIINIRDLLSWKGVLRGKTATTRLHVQETSGVSCIEIHAHYGSRLM